MSYSVDSKNRITLTRGDTMKLRISMVSSETGEEYEMQDGDALRFALKHPTLTSDGTDYEDEDPLIEKEIPSETMVLTLDPGDTEGLGFGKYVYDIQLTYADGTVDTFITPTQFKLTEEVD